MAKAKKVNKSQAIREYFDAHPGSTAKEVVAGLVKKKVKVSEALVSNVKFKAGLTKKTKGRKKAKSPVRKAVVTPAQSNGHVSLDALVDAKRLIAKTGSPEQAIAMIKALKTLDSIA